MKLLEKFPQQQGDEAKVIPIRFFRQPQQIETEKLISGVLAAAKAAFWMHLDFKPQNEDVLKELVAEHFFNGKPARENFRNLIERIFLAQENILSENKDLILSPEVWLNALFPDGLASTHGLLEEVKKLRKDVPAYKKTTSLLASLFLKYLDEPSREVFEHGRAVLLKEHNKDLFQIFCNTIIQYQFQK